MVLVAFYAMNLFIGFVIVMFADSIEEGYAHDPLDKTDRECIGWEPNHGHEYETLYQMRICNLHKHWQAYGSSLLCTYIRSQVISLIIIAFIIVIIIISMIIIIIIIF